MRRRQPAGRIVRPRSLKWKLIRFVVVDRVSGLWRWREFTLPLAALYLAYATAGSSGATMLTGLLAIVVVVVGIVQPSAVAGAPRRCIARSRWHRRWRRWPRACIGLHWYRNLARDGVLVPELLSWEQDQEQISVAVRPLSEQTASTWDAMADALRRYVGGASVEWRESRGTLHVTIGRLGLPDRLSWQLDEARQGRLRIGWRHGGSELAIDSRATAHVLLAGATGSGKGGAIRATTAAALQAGWHVVVLDPKEAGEYAWLEALGVPVVTELPEQVATLERLAEIRRARQAIVRDKGLDSWYELPLDELETGRPVLLVVDEAADLLVATKGKSGEERLRAGLQHKAGELVAELARKGRSAAIHLVVAIQRPETAQLGDQGGALRNNLTARLALGSLDADGLRMLGLSSSDPVALALDGTPGRGICVGFAGDSRPSVCQVAWLDQRRARAEVSPAYPQGLELIAPQSPAELTR